MSNHTDKIGNILDEYRKSCLLADNELFKSNYDRAVHLLSSSKIKAKSQLRNYIESEVAKSKMQGFQEGRYAETHPEILTKYE